MSKEPLDKFYSWKDRIVFVSNIPFHYKAQDVMLVMRQFGRCFRVDLARTEDGKSRGFCFVEYEKQESAERAAKYLDGAHFDNRFLRAEISKFPPEALVEIYTATARQRAEKDRNDKVRTEPEDILASVHIDSKISEVQPKEEVPIEDTHKPEKDEKHEHGRHNDKTEKKKDKKKAKHKDYSSDYSYSDYSYYYSDYSYSYSDSGYSYSYSYSSSDSEN